MKIWLAIAALAVSGFSLGFGLRNAIDPEPLDPIAAFCRGYTSGNAHAWMTFVGLSEEAYDKSKGNIEQSCIDLVSADPTTLGPLDGPLTVDEPATKANTKET